MDRASHRVDEPNYGRRDGINQGPPCPFCSHPLSPQHPAFTLLTAARLLVQRDLLRRHLATHARFAAAYLALLDLDLAKGSFKEKERAAQEIVKDIPLLAEMLRLSNLAAKARLVSRRFRKRLPTWVLRFIDGRYRGLPLNIPAPQSRDVRVFPAWDTLEWLLIEGTYDRNGWRPRQDFLCKEHIAAMLEMKVAALSPWIRDNKLRRVPARLAVTADRAWFYTTEIMALPQMCARMRNYKSPS